jgi:hypothetical protein
MRSTVLAIGWEIWARNWAGLLAVAAVILVGAMLTPALNVSADWTSLAGSCAYTLTTLALLGILGCFHFTEGSRMGGFGSFPTRLFRLPLTTRLLVGLPMIYGSAATVLVYLLCAFLLLARVSPDVPLLWPCLYLIFGLTQFQTILWSLAGSRYLKLLCLGVAASVITLGWMFFIPGIVAGTLSEWGYAGDPELFMRRLLLVLAFTGPAGYAISLFRVHQQRHGMTFRNPAVTGCWAGSIGRLLRRRAPFRSSGSALFWQEWRRTGFILPLVVVAIIGLTCVPAWLSGGLSERATSGILTWLFLAPFLFALIIGQGFGKPDFWSTNLKIAPFNAVLPVAPGPWISAKLKVAFGSSLLTWCLLIYLAFIWTAFVGDVQAPGVWLQWLRFHYSPAERWMMLLLALPAAVLITWRLLIAALPAGLCGRKLWHHLANLLAGISLVALFILNIRLGDNHGD